jgi:hypothetical protein
VKREKEKKRKLNKPDNGNDLHFVDYTQNAVKKHKRKHSDDGSGFVSLRSAWYCSTVNLHLPLGVHSALIDIANPTQSKSSSEVLQSGPRPLLTKEHLGSETESKRKKGNVERKEKAESQAPPSAIDNPAATSRSSEMVNMLYVGRLLPSSHAVIPEL